MSGPLARNDEKDIFVVFLIRCSVISKADSLRSRLRISTP